MTGSAEAAAVARKRGVRLWPTIICGLALTGLVAVFFAAVVFGGEVFYYRDFGLFFYPKRLLVTESVRRLDVPFWDNLSSAGVPILGAYQSAVFYPPALLYYLGPMPYSFMIFVVAHVALAGLGTYYMMRAFGTRKLAAWTGALLWTFAPAFISIIDNVSFITALAWLPWCVGFEKRLLSGGGWKSFAGVVVSFTMALLAGAPEPVLFTVAAMAALAAAELVQAAYDGRTGRTARRAGLLLAALVTATLVAGVELVPFASHLRYSEREVRLPVEHASVWPMEGADAARWVLPRFQLYPKRGGIYWPAQGWLKCVYLGAGATALALWTGVMLRRRRNAAFGIIAVAFAVLSFGGSSMIWRFLYDWVPGFGQARYPVKFFMPTAFAVCVLAGFAIDDMGALCRRKAHVLKRLFASLAVTGLVLIVAAAALNLWPEFGRERIIMPGPVGREEQTAAQKLLQYESSVWSLARTGGVLVASALALAAWRLRLPGFKVSTGAVVLAALVVADAGVISHDLNPTADRSVYSAAPAHLGSVERGPGAGRVVETRQLSDLLNNIRVAQFGGIEGLVSFLMSSRGTQSVSPDEILTWASKAAGKRFQSMEALDRYLSENDNTRVTEYAQFEAYKEGFSPSTNLMYGVPVANPGEVLKVKWDAALWDRLWAEGEASSAKIERLYAASTVVGWKGSEMAMTYNRPADTVKRAILVRKVLVVTGEAAVKERVCAADFDPREFVVVRSEDVRGVPWLSKVAIGAPVEIGITSAPPGEDKGQVRWVSDTGNRQVLETDCPTETLLYIADSFYPSVTAKVDGRDTEIVRANYAFRAVPLGPGRHRVEFGFRRTDLYVGACVTIAGIGAAVGACMAIRRRESRYA